MSANVQGKVGYTIRAERANIKETYESTIKQLFLKFEELQKEIKKDIQSININIT